MPALISRKPQRALAVTALVVAALIGVAIWMAQSGQTASAPDVSTVTATRGDVVVTVGGVGRIVTGSGVVDRAALLGRKLVRECHGIDERELDLRAGGCRVRASDGARRATAREARPARHGGRAARATR